MPETTMFEKATRLKDQAAALEAMCWLTEGPCADRFNAMGKAAQESYLAACSDVADGCGELASEISMHGVTGKLVLDEAAP